MNDDVITLGVSWILLANIIFLWSDSLLRIKLAKLLPQRILGDFLMITIIYFYNNYYWAVVVIIWKPGLQMQFDLSGKPFTHKTILNQDLVKCMKFK